MFAAQPDLVLDLAHEPGLLPVVFRQPGHVVACQQTVLIEQQLQQVGVAATILPDADDQLLDPLFGRQTHRRCMSRMAWLRASMSSSSRPSLMAWRIWLTFSTSEVEASSTLA